MLRFPLAMLAVAATVVLAACGSSASAITGKDWQLTAITEKVPAYQGVVPVSEQSKFTVTFEDGTLGQLTAARLPRSTAVPRLRSLGSDGRVIVTVPMVRPQATSRIAGT